MMFATYSSGCWRRRGASLGGFRGHVSICGTSPDKYILLGQKIKLYYLFYVDQQADKRTNVNRKEQRRKNKSTEEYNKNKIYKYNSQ